MQLTQVTSDVVTSNVIIQSTNQFLFDANNVGRIPGSFITANTITANLIQSVSNTAISGLIQSNQISNISNTQITGLIQSNQIANISNTQIIGTTLPGAGQVTSIMLDRGSSTGNGAISIPIGNTAQRPANATIGMVRMNTDMGVLENYTTSGWLKVSIPVPIISSISGTIYAGNTSTIIINGSNFENTQGTITLQISGSSPVSISATPNAGGTQVSCLVPSGIYSTVSAGTSVSVTFTNADGGTSSGYIMTAAGLPTGGTVTQTGNTRVHTFTSSGSLVVPAGFTSSIDYLIVAGGGGGGGRTYHGGGGGAGGLRTGTTTITQQTYTITIGAGGPGYATSSDTAHQGQDSSAIGITSSGGGGGGGTAAGNDGVGYSGGSGGGSSVRISSTSSGVSGQGNAGGAGAPSGSEGPNYGAGGGGGAGSVGGTGTSTAGGNGGSGLQSSISGTSTWYAGGGGGSVYASSSSGSGGSGIGGAGAYGSGGGNGATNTGSGGGGRESRGSENKGSGNGGSGIVIIRYQLA